MSELAIEETPDVADAAREAAGGQVVYITERGEPLAVIMRPDLAAALERLSAELLEEAAAAARKGGHDEAAELLEDLADRAAVLESRAAGGPGIPWEQLRAEAGL